MVARVKKAQSSKSPPARQPDGASRDQEALSFEALLSDLPAALVRVSADQIDDETERWLERIVLAMAVDRGNVVQVDPMDGGLYITHQWGRPGVLTPDRGQKTDNTKWYPWLVGRVLSGELTVFSSLKDLPPEASKDVVAARHVGAKSIVTIPLKVGGTVAGAFLVDTAFSERTWSEKTVQRLKLVAEMIGNALERIRSEAKKYELKKRTLSAPFKSENKL